MHVLIIVGQPAVARISRTLTSSAPFSSDRLPDRFLRNDLHSAEHDKTGEQVAGSVHRTESAVLGDEVASKMLAAFKSRE